MISKNDDKRLQTYDEIASYPYGRSVGKVCKTKILSTLNRSCLIIIIL